MMLAVMYGMMPSANTDKRSSAWPLSRLTMASTPAVELPAAVELTVSQTDPGVQGDRSTGGTKPATLETGVQIQVPLFITTGEKIKVDTRTGDYLGRA